MTPPAAADWIAPTHRSALINAALGSLAVGYLWNTTVLRPALYPLTLFVSFVHETGQRLVVALTGGTSTHFTIESMGLGQSDIVGGSAWLSLPAGYFTTMVVGALLFYWLNRHPQQSQRVGIGLGLVMILGTLYYVPQLPQADTNWLIGLGFGLALIIVGRWAPLMPRLALLNLMIVPLALEALLSVRYVARVRLLGDDFVPDALAFAQQVVPGLSPDIVAFSWAAIALGVFAFVFSISAWHLFQPAAPPVPANNSA